MARRRSPLAGPFPHPPGRTTPVPEARILLTEVGILRDQFGTCRPAGVLGLDGRLDLLGMVGDGILVSPSASKASLHNPLKKETGATLPCDMGSVHIAEALKRVTSRTGGKPTVIARGPGPCCPGFLGPNRELAPGFLAPVSEKFASVFIMS